MKKTSTISLTIQEFASIQSRTFGKTAVALWASTRTARAGSARNSSVRKTKGRSSFSSMRSADSAPQHT